MRRTRWVVALAVAVVAAVFAITVAVVGDRPYRLSVMMPTADNAIKGSAVLIGGQEVGKVTSVGVVGNAAKLTLELGGDRVPLHAGTVARVAWNSVIGRRQVVLEPGKETNPELSSGHLIESKVERVELDDLLNTLDAPTRAKVQQLVASLEAVLQGNQKNLQTTLQQAGPLVEALSQVMKSVNADQPALDALIPRLHEITGTLSSRNARTADTVKQLSATVSAIAEEEDALTRTFDELPGTLRDASTLFGHVPGAVDATVPLLEQLRPTTKQLPAVAKDLNPVLTDLRPTVADLRPTLDATAPLLKKTPDLLDIGTETVPDVETALTTLQPAVSFLRPYTPELIGFLTNWASLFSAKNASGHFGRALIPVSGSMVNSNPGVLPPGMTQWKEPDPGQLVDQSWTDANGDGVR